MAPARRLITLRNVLLTRRTFLALTFVIAISLNLHSHFSHKNSHIPSKKLGTSRLLPFPSALLAAGAFIAASREASYTLSFNQKQLLWSPNRQTLDFGPIPTPSPPPSRLFQVEESDDCQIPRPPRPCHLSPGERIHLVLLTADWTEDPLAANETDLLLKSILLQTQCDLTLHFLVQDRLEISTLQIMMSALGAIELSTRPLPLLNATPVTTDLPTQNPLAQHGNATWLVYHFHPLPLDWLYDRAQTLALLPLLHPGGLPAISRFFLPEILGEIDRVLYLDTDAIVGGDLQDLWDYFRGMGEGVLYLAGKGNGEGWDGGRVGRVWSVEKQSLSCSQMVMDLKRMREANLTQLLLESLGSERPHQHKDFRPDGDQWLFHMVCRAHPRMCEILPREWNANGCSREYPILGLSERGKLTDGTCWRMAHFDCLRADAGRVKESKMIYKLPMAWHKSYEYLRDVDLRSLTRNSTAF